MGRWAADPRGRLARAAFDLFAGQGYEQTTGAQIAERAGMHERSFFRIFGDKREVLFAAFDEIHEQMRDEIAAAPPSASPLAVVRDALGRRCAYIAEGGDLAAVRHAIITGNDELRERDLRKHAELAATIATALVDRGTPTVDADLIAEAALAVFRIAIATWVTDRAAGRDDDLVAIFDADLDRLGELLGGGRSARR